PHSHYYLLNDPPPPPPYPLSLHDALPIFRVNPDIDAKTHAKIATGKGENKFGIPISRAREVYARAAKLKGVHAIGVDMHIGSQIDRKSTRLNSSHVAISYAVFCLKKKKNT